MNATGESKSSDGGGPQERPFISVEGIQIVDHLEDVDCHLDDLLREAAPAWESIADADAWLAELRGTAHSDDLESGLPSLRV